MNNFDLHNHSNCSDGLLAPGELMALAAEGGCDAVALTDHDTLAGLDSAASAAANLNLRFIPGVEISVTWRPQSLHTTLHIVGLNIDPAEAGINQQLQSVRAGRHERAARIAADFDRIGFTGSLEGAYQHAEHPDMIGRTHFARYLVASGKVKSLNQAFERYLVEGKPGYVRHDWVTLAESVAWIKGAGGLVVMAHPGRYKITSEQMRELLTEFRALGGDAIEVVTGSHTGAQYTQYARLAREYGFMASRGADFHGRGESPFLPGKLPPLPDGLAPIWARF